MCPGTNDHHGNRYTMLNIQTKLQYFVSLVSVWLSVPHEKNSPLLSNRWKNLLWNCKHNFIVIKNSIFSSTSEICSIGCSFFGSEAFFCHSVRMAELHLIGQILSACDFEEPTLFCKWSIQYGKKNRKRRAKGCQLN